MTRPIRRPRAFTLIELLVVIAIIGIMATLLMVAVGRVVEAGRTTACMSNLRQISLGLQTYRTEFGNFCPPGDLPASLQRFIGEPDVFVCPNDHDPDYGDSYSEFYIPRGEQDSQTAVICCPRHGGDSRTGALYGNTGVQTGSTATARHNGRPVAAGEVVIGGQLAFEDGSLAELSDNLQVQVLTTFHESDGRLYTILRLLPNQTGTVQANVHEGSKFEVVTPAVIAGVQGTRFLVGYVRTSVNYSARVKVLRGEVYLQSVGTPYRVSAIQKARSQGFWEAPPEMRPSRQLIERPGHRFWKEAHVVTNSDDKDAQTYPFKPLDGVNNQYDSRLAH